MRLAGAFWHRHRAILPAAAMGNWGTCLGPKHMEQLGTNWANISDCGISVESLCSCFVQAMDLTAGSYLAYSADKGQSIPQGFHAKVKHLRASFSFNRCITPMPNRWKGKYITTEFIRFNQTSSSKGKKKTYTGVHLRTCSCQITFDLLSYRWRKKWSCGTSPAESFMTLPLPGCWSLTKVCPVELRSTMDTFKGSTSAKVPEEKGVVPCCSLNGVTPAGWFIYVYFMANPII